MTHSNNNTSVVPFDFEGNQVRTIKDHDGEIWFVASDVCKSLDLSNVSQALTRLDTDEKDDIILNDTMGRQQSTAIISESGLYALVLSSRKPEAKLFKRWVTKEVLPSIRKTGGYSIQSSDDPITANISMIRAIADSLEAFQERQNSLENDHLALEQRVNRLDNKNRMFTVVAYARLCHKDVTSSQASAIGKRASKLSKQKHIECGQVYDARWGYVKTYREDILEQAWGE